MSAILPDRLPPPLEPDRGGYTLTMRECCGAERVLERLAQGLPGDGAARVHMGWGSFRNLDAAAARQSEWVVLLDVNRHQFSVWRAVAGALCDPAVEDPASFVDAVVPRLPATPRLRQFADSTRRWLGGDLERPGSWLFLGAPERFRHVSGLFRRGRVATACVDLRGGRGGARIFEQLAARMRAAQAAGRATFDTLYVSNIPWMLAQPRGFFDEPHAAHVADPQRPVLVAVRENLARIAPCFAHVISAARLRADAPLDNLQWCSELLSPTEFLAPDYWVAIGQAGTGST